MNQSITEALEHEVARFRSWAENHSHGRFGEWECDYPDWGRLYTAVSDFISISNIRDWNQSVIGLLIYAIARDNECEHLAELLREDVRSSFKTRIFEADWQGSCMFWRLKGGTRHDVDPQVVAQAGPEPHGVQDGTSTGTL